MSVALTSSAVANPTQLAPLRVMVVDDSVVIRGMISRWIGAESDMVVAASLRTGLDAVNQIERINPDVAVLDIEMPDLDGISALPQLLAKKRNLIVIMASTLTRRNAEISFKALSLGAADYIPKPESTRESTAAETFRHDLLQKIRHLGAKVRRPASAPSPSIVPAPRPPLAPSAPLTRRSFSSQNPRVLLIGSSTGGPQALRTLVPRLPAELTVPIAIVLHMPVGYTELYAQRLDQLSALTVQVEALAPPLTTSSIPRVTPGFSTVPRHARARILRPSRRTEPKVDFKTEPLPPPVGPVSVGGAPLSPAPAPTPAPVSVSSAR